MHYLYHLVPSQMKEDTLYPLNRLKGLYPEIYQKQVRKYEGREKLMETVIPSLGCLWNDVLFLTAVHPTTLVRELTEAGLPMESSLRFYAVDPAMLDASLLTVYLYRTVPGRSTIREYESFQVSNLPKYATIHEETKQYFRNQVVNRRRPFLFHLVPHILYKGTIKVSGLEIVEPQTPLLYQ